MKKQKVEKIDINTSVFDPKKLSVFSLKKYQE